MPLLSLLLKYWRRFKFSFFQFLVALDQTGNTLIGGWADETISARAYRRSGVKRRWAIARSVIDAGARLFGQKNHCYQSWISEIVRSQSPPEERILLNQ